MEFNEKVHAFIAATYYVHLRDRFGRRGKAAFIHGVQYYAGQRGRRMAQRAIRDGRELTHETFVQYGELAATSEPSCSHVASLSPDYELHITDCPWHRQFEEMGCLEAGDVYCTYLDEALCRGFNPSIAFQARANLNTSAYCIHRVVGVHYGAPPAGLAAGAYKRDFSYHCGHLYWAFSEVCAAIFGPEGEAVSAGVLADFEARYGPAMARELSGWRDTNFNLC